LWFSIATGFGCGAAGLKFEMPVNSKFVSGVEADILLNCCMRVFMVREYKRVEEL
jgi:hypothetical protein